MHPWILGSYWSKGSFLWSQVISSDICELGHGLYGGIAFFYFSYFSNFSLFVLDFSLKFCDQKEALYDEVISSDICEWGHGLCSRIAFVLERVPAAQGPVRKFPKLCNQQQQESPNKSQSCPKQNRNLHFCNSAGWNHNNHLRMNAALVDSGQLDGTTVLTKSTKKSTKSFKCEVINVVKTLTWSRDIWLKTILKFSPQLHFRWMTW